jgi:hypothetical protein
MGVTHGYGQALVLTRVADADLSTKQGYVVKLTTTGCALAGAGLGFGVLLNKPTLAQLAAVLVGNGTVQAQVDATVAIVIGDSLVSNASSVLVKATTGGADQNIIGIALESKASGTGLIEVFVRVQSDSSDA